VKTVYLDCIGCEQRWLDVERIRAYLKVNGFALVDAPVNADVLVLVTCAVDDRSETLSMERLRDLASGKDRNCRLIVGGCLPSISPGALASIEVGGLFSPRTLDNFDELLGNVSVPMNQISDPHTTPNDKLSPQVPEPSNVRQEYDRAKRGFKIRINHGCLLSCSYCVIRKATGRLHSIPQDDVIAAFETAVQRKEATIMLMGGDTGAYGLDIGSDFATLLLRLLAYEGTHRIFIHDFNVNWLIRSMPSFASVLQGKSERLRAACIPIQSGSDEVLKRMRRPYKTRDVLRALRWIQQNAPHIALGTHIIIGFPGESDLDFQQTVELLRQVDFDFVTCFPYSEHSAAPSVNLDHKVASNAILDRMAQLGDILGGKATMLS